LTQERSAATERFHDPFGAAIVRQVTTCPAAHQNFDARFAIFLQDDNATIDPGLSGGHCGSRGGHQPRRTGTDYCDIHEFFRACLRK
jgi:hypothetical protein